MLGVAEGRGLAQNEQEWSRSLPFRMLEIGENLALSRENAESSPTP